MAYKLDFRPKNMARTSPYTNVVRTPPPPHDYLRIVPEKSFLTKLIFHEFSMILCYEKLSSMSFQVFHGVGSFSRFSRLSMTGRNPG